MPSTIEERLAQFRSRHESLLQPPPAVSASGLWTSLSSSTTTGMALEASTSSSPAHQAKSTLTRARSRSPSPTAPSPTACPPATGSVPSPPLTATLQSPPVEKNPVPAKPFRKVFLQSEEDVRDSPISHTAEWHEPRCVASGSLLHPPSFIVKSASSLSAPAEATSCHVPSPSSSASPAYPEGIRAAQQQLDRISVLSAPDFERLTESLTALLATHTLQLEVVQQTLREAEAEQQTAKSAEQRRTADSDSTSRRGLSYELPRRSLRLRYGPSLIYEGTATTATRCEGMAVKHGFHSDTEAAGGRSPRSASSAHRRRHSPTPLTPKSWRGDETAGHPVWSRTRPQPTSLASIDSEETSHLREVRPAESVVRYQRDGHGVLFYDRQQRFFHRGEWRRDLKEGGGICSLPNSAWQGHWRGGRLVGQAFVQTTKLCGTVTCAGDTLTLEEEPLSAFEKSCKDNAKVLKDKRVSDCRGIALDGPASLELASGWRFTGVLGCRPDSAAKPPLPNHTKTKMEILVNEFRSSATHSPAGDPTASEVWSCFPQGRLDALPSQCTAPSSAVNFSRNATSLAALRQAVWCCRTRSGLTEQSVCYGRLVDQPLHRMETRNAHNRTGESRAPSPPREYIGEIDDHLRPHGWGQWWLRTSEMRPPSTEAAAASSGSAVGAFSGLPAEMLTVSLVHYGLFVGGEPSAAVPHCVEGWSDGEAECYRAHWIYVGGWREGQMQGHGVLWHRPRAARLQEEAGTPTGMCAGAGEEEGYVYTGEWEKGKMHGLGRIVYPNNDVWEGFFSADEQQSGRYLR